MGQAKRRKEAGERISYCRTCTYCCSLPEIHALSKPAYHACRHIENGGCAIFGRPERPPACTAYVCAYLAARLADAPERNRIPHPLDCGAYFHRDPVEKVIFLFVDPKKPMLWKASPLAGFLRVQIGAGFALGLRYAYFWSIGEITGHFQSAILSVLLLILGFQTLQWGVMADLIASNRKLIEDLLYRVRKLELDKRG